MARDLLLSPVIYAITPGNILILLAKIRLQNSQIQLSGYPLLFSITW